MTTDVDGLLRALYAAFNARDVEGALAHLHPDVDWPNGMEGGRVRGREAVREYWRRQFAAIDSHVEPERIEAHPDGAVVHVHQVVRDRSGAPIADARLRHAFRLEGGRVVRMDVLDA